MDDVPWTRLEAHAAGWSVPLDSRQIESLRLYLDRLCEWNERFNLTAIRDPQEILWKHFLDSLTCARAVSFADRHSLIDVGTGAGFPGLVLKIAFPHLEVVLLDAVHKRLGFLERVIEELELEGVRTLHARAEDAARTPAAGRGRTLPAPGERLREQFDVVVARAVARLNVLAEWLLPFARVGGCALAMKGPDVQPEVEEARRAVQLLGGGEPRVTELVLPEADVGRSLVAIPKVRTTPPTYPRLPGTARKSPL